jgi:hypothetical protein
MLTTAKILRFEKPKGTAMAGKHRVSLPSQEVLKQMLDYDPKSGLLWWKHRTPEMFASTAGRSQLHSCAQFNSKWGGKLAIDKEWNGYLVGRLNYLNVQAHRVIWKWMTGEDADVVDHIDGNGCNNAFVNLRNVTEGENHRNRKLRGDNKYGVHGVRFDRKSKKWVAIIQITCPTLEEAVAARKAAEAVLGYHENHGRKAA